MVEALAEIIAWATAETATTMTTEVQEIGAQQKEVGEAAAAADLVAAVARAPPAAAQAATMVAALRVTAVTKVVEVLLDHLDDRMRPLSTVENLVVVAVWLTARVAEMMSACAAVAVGLKTVGTVVVSAKVEVLARGVVVQAVGEVYKVTSLAALVVVLAVLVEDQMVAQVAVRGVATKLGLHNTMERWGLGLRVTIKVGTKVKAQTPVVLVLTVGNFAQHQDPRGSDRRHQDEIGGNDERPRGGRRRSDGGRDGGRVGQCGGAVGARGGAGGGRGARGDELGGARRGSGGARPGPGAGTSGAIRRGNQSQAAQEFVLAGVFRASGGVGFLAPDGGHGSRAGHGGHCNELVDLMACAATPAARELPDTRPHNRSTSATVGHADDSVKAQRAKRLPSGDDGGCLRDALAHNLPGDESRAGSEADGAGLGRRRLQHAEPVVETRAAKQMGLDFHSIPITCLTTVPELGLLGVIRSQAASIRNSGAHVFRIAAPEIRPVPSLAPQRKVGVKVRVRVQTFPQYPTIVSESFAGIADPDPAIKRDGLQAQVPPEREMMLSTAVIKRKMRESTTALRARYKDFGVTQFLQNVNDLRVTWVRGVTSGGHETRALGPAKPNPIDVHYVSDMTPANEDGCGRSLGASACAAEPEPLLSSERFHNPRTLNHHRSLGACAT